MERTLILAKPDAMQRGLGGEVISRFERRGLRLVALKLLRITDAMARQHYAEHDGKPFFDGLVEYITSAPVIAAVFEGPNAIVAVRQTVGSTKPFEAAPGTIRADYGVETGRNLVHASDKPESAEREIALFFRPEELVEWSRDVDRWVFVVGAEWMSRPPSGSRGPLPWGRGTAGAPCAPSLPRPRRRSRERAGVRAKRGRTLRSERLGTREVMVGRPSGKSGPLP